MNAPPKPEPLVSLASGVREECASFSWNGLQLRAVLSLPPKTPSGILVTVHGWASTRSGPSGMLAGLCRTAASNASTALRFDLPGRGESDGDYDDTDLDAMIDATVAAADFLREKYPGLPIRFCGICSGANIALAAAALCQTKIEGVLALSALPYQEHRGPFERVRRSLGNVRTYVRKAFRLSTWKRLLKGEVDIKGVGRAVAAKDAAFKGGRNLKQSRRDIPAALARYQGRVSLVWGGRDPEAPAAENYFRRVLRYLPHPPEITYVDGANHNFYGIDWHRQIAALFIRLADTPHDDRIRVTEET